MVKFDNYNPDAVEKLSKYLSGLLDIVVDDDELYDLINDIIIDMNLDLMGIDDSDNSDDETEDTEEDEDDVELEELDLDPTLQLFDEFVGSVVSSMEYGDEKYPMSGMILQDAAIVDKKIQLNFQAIYGFRKSVVRIAPNELSQFVLSSNEEQSKDANFRISFSSNEIIEYFDEHAELVVDFSDNTLVN